MTAIDRILTLAALPAAELPAPSRAMARLSLFDWMVCGRAGAGEPLAGILREMIAAEGGRPVASVIGGAPAPARAAALVNGATSHALDYDDTHFAHVGHPSVAILPAALAVAEELDAPASEVADAFLLGAEVSIRVGLQLGRGHYERGFHQTATAGAFGATVAAGRLMGLHGDGLRAALGLCATRASGLRGQFGTMGKPYNAGLAAANGVECASLAARGFTSADDGLDGPQGFVATHSDAPDAAAAWAEPPPARFLFDDIRYKLHACCHGTHAMIEALAALRDDGVAARDVSAIRLRTNPRWLTVCDIKAPRTGLEVKFSYAWLAGMVLQGHATARERIYTDALAADPALAAFAERVEVVADASLSDMQAEGEVVLADGARLPFAHDLADPIDRDALEGRLRAKAEALLGAEAETLWQSVRDLDGIGARALGRMLAPA
jgi:2-methylcitrate dehydratase PrpD